MCRQLNKKKAIKYCKANKTLIGLQACDKFKYCQTDRRVNNFFSPVAAGFVVAGFLAGVFDLRSVLDFSASCWKGRYKGGGGSSIREVNVHCPSQTF